jgi:hypothetical protein
MQILILQLNVLDNPMKHWSNRAGWEMAYICEQVLKKTRAIVVSSRFLFLNAYEVTTIDN